MPESGVPHIITRQWALPALQVALVASLQRVRLWPVWVANVPCWRPRCTLNLSRCHHAKQVEDNCLLCIGKTTTSQTSYANWIPVVWHSKLLHMHVLCMSTYMHRLLLVVHLVQLFITVVCTHDHTRPHNVNLYECGLVPSLMKCYVRTYVHKRTYVCEQILHIANPSMGKWMHLFIVSAHVCVSYLMIYV